jgi:hypothetical protein
LGGSKNPWFSFFLQKATPFEAQKRFAFLGFHQNFYFFKQKKEKVVGRERNHSKPRGGFDAPGPSDLRLNPRHRISHHSNLL